MKIELLNTIEQFKEIKKGDSILVEWSDYYVRHTPKAKKIMFYSIYLNKDSHSEIICQIKENHYFNYEMYLEGASVAREVYKVTDDKELESI